MAPVCEKSVTRKRAGRPTDQLTPLRPPGGFSVSLIRISPMMRKETTKNGKQLDTFFRPGGGYFARGGGRTDGRKKRAEEAAVSLYVLLGTELQSG